MGATVLRADPIRSAMLTGPQLKVDDRAPNDRACIARSTPGLAPAGFSLIELLIVAVVLGIIGIVTVVVVRGLSGKSEIVSCDEDRRVMATAVKSYFAQLETTSIPASYPVDGTTSPTPEAPLTEGGLLVVSPSPTTSALTAPSPSKRVRTADRVVTSGPHSVLDFKPT